MKDSKSMNLAKENLNLGCFILFFMIKCFSKALLLDTDRKYNKNYVNSIQLFHFAVFDFQDHLGKCQKVAVACPNCNKKAVQKRYLLHCVIQGVPKKFNTSCSYSSRFYTADDTAEIDTTSVKTNNMDILV